MKRLARWLECGPPVRRLIAIGLCCLCLYAAIHIPAYLGLFLDGRGLTEWEEQ